MSNTKARHPGPDTTVKVRVWDLPTRIFHWSLVLCVIGSFVTIKLGGLWMDWHVRFGLVTTGLLLFRLVWGIIGPHYARFSQFVRGPRVVFAYIGGSHPHVAGHNPLGALSVIALLLVFGFQAFTGLFADDDIFTSGPLAYLSSSWSGTFTGLHKLSEWLLLALVAFHVITVVWYRVFRKQRLTGPMIHGNVSITNISEIPVPASDGWTIRIGALLLALAVGMATWWLTTLAPVGGGMSFM